MESQHDKDKAKTGLRLAVLFFVVFFGVRKESKGNAVLWRQPSTSPHCCCNQRPSAAASEGERLDCLIHGDSKSCVMMPFEDFC